MTAFDGQLGGTILAAMAAGAAAFAHCLGMCGALALHLSAGAERWSALGRQLCWHAGRIVTYTFLGSLAGANCELHDGEMLE